MRIAVPVTALFLVYGALGGIGGATELLLLACWLQRRLT